MATPTVYVICDQNCKFEGMTKEQILTAIAQAVESGEIKDVDAGFIQTVKTINGVPLRFFVGEQSAYDALTEEEKNGLFAIITNDTTKDDLLADVEYLKKRVKELGELATADHATTADKATYATSAGTADKATTATTATKANKIASLGAAADNVARCVWFSDSDEKELPRRDDDFKYNPYTNTLIVPYIDGSLKSAMASSSKPCKFSVGGNAITDIALPSGKTLDDIIMMQLIGSGALPHNLTGFVTRNYNANADYVDFSGLYAGGAYMKIMTLRCQIQYVQNKLCLGTLEYYATEFRDERNHITTLIAENGDKEDLFYAYVICYFR